MIRCYEATIATSRLCNASNGFVFQQDSAPVHHDTELFMQMQHQEMPQFMSTELIAAAANAVWT